VRTSHVWFRAECNFDTEKASLSYSVDGKQFRRMGGGFTMVYQGRTFQGVRYSLFHFNTGGSPGGYADFISFNVSEPRPRGLTKPIPIGRAITLSSLVDGASLAVKDGILETAKTGGVTTFKVIDRERGRVALQAPGGFLSVGGAGKAGEVKVKAGEIGDAETFQWVDLQRGDILFLSLATHRYLRAPESPGAVSADHPGPRPDRKDGSRFAWNLAARP
jgi:xylan 1,4-beta-xylosidase